MPKTSRKTDWIFQRPGSANWWIKLRSDGKRTERSLGTSDREHAVILSLPMIAEHKAKLLAARPRLEKTWARQFTPGLHDGLDGDRIFATDRELHYLDASGAPVHGGPAFQVRSLAEAFIVADFGDGRGERRTPPTKE